MKKAVAAAVLVVLAGAATAQARVDFNVNIAVPLPVAPAPVVTTTAYPNYGYAGYAPPAAAAVPPQFIYTPALGFYVSVGLPYDIVYADNSYYQYRGGYWYGSPSYRGPWTYVSNSWLPPVLHRHHHDRIRYYRDREYRSYLNDRDHYRGRWYRPVAVIDRRYDRRDEPRYDRRYGNEHKEYKDKNRDGRWDHRDGRWDHRDGRWELK